MFTFSNASEVYRLLALFILYHVYQIWRILEFIICFDSSPKYLTENLLENYMVPSVLHQQKLVVAFELSIFFKIKACPVSSMHIYIYRSV